MDVDPGTVDGTVAAYVAALDGDDFVSAIGRWNDLERSTRYRIETEPGTRHRTIYDTRADIAIRVPGLPVPALVAEYNAHVSDVVTLRRGRAYLQEPDDLPALDTAAVAETVDRYAPRVPDGLQEGFADVPPVDIDHPFLVAVDDALDQARRGRAIVQETLGTYTSNAGTLSKTLFEHGGRLFLLDEGEELPPGWEPRIEEVGTVRDAFTLDDLVEHYRLVSEYGGEVDARSAHLDRSMEDGELVRDVAFALYHRDRTPEAEILSDGESMYAYRWADDAFVPREPAPAPAADVTVFEQLFDPATFGPR